MATGFTWLTFSEPITGMRITRTNNTKGLSMLTLGGVNVRFANFTFQGDSIGRPYDFYLEIFGVSDSSKQVPLILLVMIGTIVCLF